MTQETNSQYRLVVRHQNNGKLFERYLEKRFEQFDDKIVFLSGMTGLGFLKTAYPFPKYHRDFWNLKLNVKLDFDTYLDLKRVWSQELHFHDTDFSVDIPVEVNYSPFLYETDEVFGENISFEDFKSTAYCDDMYEILKQRVWNKASFNVNTAFFTIKINEVFGENMSLKDLKSTTYLAIYEKLQEQLHIQYWAATVWAYGYDNHIKDIFLLIYKNPFDSELEKLLLEMGKLHKKLVAKLFLEKNIGTEESPIWECEADGGHIEYSYFSITKEWCFYSNLEAIKETIRSFYSKMPNNLYQQVKQQIAQNGYNTSVVEIWEEWSSITGHQEHSYHYSINL